LVPTHRMFLTREHIPPALQRHVIFLYGATRLSPSRKHQFPCPVSRKWRLCQRGQSSLASSQRRQLNRFLSRGKRSVLRPSSPQSTELISPLSAAIYAIVSFFACLQPTTTFLIFGVIPCPAWAWVSGIFLFDGYSALADKVRQGTIDLEP
jgi:hypothetical protein